MQTFIALIRGINVGGHKLVKMADLKVACEAMGLRDVRTHLQSGNVVFRTARTGRAALVKEIKSALGVEAEVILRTAEELQAAIAANPMKEASDRDPSHTVVVFLDKPPSAEAMSSLREGYSGPEAMQLHGAELYVDYGNEMARSKLTNVIIERKLGVTATARNWNTVTRLAELAGS